jgi:hypothetical protein
MFGGRVLRARRSGNRRVESGGLRTHDRLQFSRDGAIVQPPESHERGSEK